MQFFRVCIYFRKYTLKWTFTSRPPCTHDCKLTASCLWQKVCSRESWKLPGNLAICWICVRYHALRKQICQVHRCFSSPFLSWAQKISSCYTSCQKKSSGGWHGDLYEVVNLIQIQLKYPFKVSFFQYQSSPHSPNAQPNVFSYRHSWEKELVVTFDGFCPQHTENSLPNNQQFFLVFNYWIYNCNKIMCLFYIF